MPSAISKVGGQVGKLAERPRIQLVCIVVGTAALPSDVKLIEG